MRGLREKPASILELLEDIEPVPSSLRKEIMAESNQETLKKRLRMAAQAEKEPTRQPPNEYPAPPQNSQQSRWLFHVCPGQFSQISKSFNSKSLIPNPLTPAPKSAKPPHKSPTPHTR